MLNYIHKGEVVMDMNKFYKMLIEDERISEMPMTLVLRIAIVVLDIINSGECIYEVEHI